MSPSPSEVWSLFSVAVKESSVVSSAALVPVIALFNPHDISDKHSTVVQHKVNNFIFLISPV